MAKKHIKRYLTSLVIMQTKGKTNHNQNDNEYEIPLCTYWDGKKNNLNKECW